MAAAFSSEAGSSSQFAGWHGGLAISAGYRSLKEHTIVPRVGDVHIAAAVNSNRCRVIEGAGLHRSLGVPARRRALYEHAIVSRVSDVDVAGPVKCDARRE